MALDLNSTIRVAVLGTGSLGKEHARIYADLAKAGLVSFAGVFDVIQKPRGVMPRGLACPRSPVCRRPPPRAMP